MDNRLGQVRCFLLDMDGTVNLGDRLLPGAEAFFEVLRRRHRDYLFLTNNSSRHGRHYAEKMSRLGLSTPESKVLTSGEATARYLAATRPDARVFLLGTPELRQDFIAQGICLDDQTPDMVVVGFDTTLTYDRLWRMCDFVRAGLAFIATHADLNCPTEDGSMPDVGSLLALVETSTGRRPDLIVGKPNRLIVETAAAKLGLPLEALAMIGDRLYTDIALGKSAGILTVLVLSGEARRDDLADSPDVPDYVFDDLGAVAEWLEGLPSD